ncbi:clathrin light chain 2-like [Impatiens glandulifera]|uniref:clathrin light chain 2-like n=1 Tax=Impatiens glandulifera TaxID=253017 RepID=UPI001FB182C8|nr:clathrin light chain 2-like [Impatiens glandulifera]
MSYSFDTPDAVSPQTADDGVGSAFDSPVFTGSLNATFGSHPISYTESPVPIHVSFGEFSPDHTEKLSDSGFASSDGQILPPPSEMNHMECSVLGEWRRQNAVRIEEKERKEKELLSQILTEADGYKVEFYNKRQINYEVNKSTNMEKEKLFIVNQEKFHGEANKNYWNTIAELIPNEMPAAIEKRTKKNEHEKKPAIAVVQGPKPGKPTDLARMRQILLKLKHNTPPHLKYSPQTATTSTAATPPSHVETVVVA